MHTISLITTVIEEPETLLNFLVVDVDVKWIDRMCVDRSTLHCFIQRFWAPINSTAYTQTPHPRMNYYPYVKVSRLHQQRAFLPAICHMIHLYKHSPNFTLRNSPTSTVYVFCVLPRKTKASVEVELAKFVVLMPNSIFKDTIE
jgi:hypothetical protein